MYTNEDTIKLFDSNNNFVQDFDKKIEEIEISIHGENYYDIDEDLNKEEKVEIKEEIKEEPKKTKKKAKGIHFKDFLPVLFILLIFGIVTYAGYYFLGNIDVSSFINNG